MKIIVRHPRQVVDHAAFRPGEEYALIRASESDVACAGRSGAVRSRHGATFISCVSMTFVEALDNGEMPAAVEALRRRPGKEHEIRFTTHEIHGEILVVSWRWNGALYDKWAFSDMDAAYIGKHLLFVPLGDWIADPRVHVVDWVNPKDVCPAVLTWAEEEVLLRRRRDAAMRRALGFE